MAPVSSTPGTSEQRDGLESFVTSVPVQAPPVPSSFGRRVVISVVVIAVIAGGAYGAVRLLSGGASEDNSQLLTAPVQRGDLLVTVTEDGNLESAVNIDVKCEVAGGTSILWIIEDGKEVKKGEKLVEFDSSALEEQINQQRITFEKARAAKIQAEKDYAAAKLAVDEYLEGTYVQQLQDQEAQITIGLENLRSAENTLEHAERMFRKGYISALDLESQRFAVQRAQLDLDSAKTAQNVLEKYTKVKTVQDLESKRDSSEAQMRSEGASFDLEESRLKRLEGQLEHCIVTAPADGMAVYANEQRGRFGGSSQPQIEEGAMVRERQTILRLPDLSKMQVKVNVHESKIEMLGLAWKKAMAAGNNLPARIQIQNRMLDGALSNIANQPEPTSFFSGNVKEYATTVSIEGTPEGLRPGMTAKCEILVDDLHDVLKIPVAAVVELNEGYFAWVKTRTGLERRPLVLGATNDQFVEVKDGIKEGDLLVLNPRAMVKEARGEREAKPKGDEGAAFKHMKTKQVDGGPGAEPGQGPPGAGGPGGPAIGMPSGGPPRSGGGGPPAAAAADGSGSRAAGDAGGKRGAFNLMQFDKDGDGKVSKDEAPAQMQSFFDRLDGNGDGFIDSAEVGKMRNRARSGGGPPQ